MKVVFFDGVSNFSIGGLDFVATGLRLNSHLVKFFFTGMWFNFRESLKPAIQD